MSKRKKQQPAKAKAVDAGNCRHFTGGFAYERMATVPQARVDAEAGIIRDLCILGPVSIGYDGKVRRRYLESAMRAAVPLYEGVMVNCDHPPGHDLNADRPSDKRLGLFQNVRYEGGRIRGDLVFLKTHPMAARICEAAGDPIKSRVYGFSHGAEFDVEYAKDGIPEVTKITRVVAVDLVSDGATTQSLFESQAKENRIMEGDTSVAGTMEQNPQAGAGPLPAEESDENGFEGSPFDSVLDALGESYQNGEIDDSEFLTKIKLAMKLHGPDKKPEASGDAEEDEGEECKGEEAESKGGKRTTKPCSYDDAIRCLESAGVSVKLPHIKAIRACESKEAREELAATWKPEATGGTASKAGQSPAKPRSGSEKPKSTPATSATESKGGWADPDWRKKQLGTR